MKKVNLSILLTFALAAILTACGGKPKQSRCDVEVYTPLKQYTEARLLDTHGRVIDSTLVIKNDSVRFSRNDVKEMPYVADIQLRNPKDSIDILVMPIVIEGGTVKLDLTDRISLSGTDDNERLFKFLKNKNSFIAKYQNENHDLAKLKADYSRYFLDQLMQNKGTIVGDYIYETYSSFLEPLDLKQAREIMEETSKEN